jgi:hypothetical protein
MVFGIGIIAKQPMRYDRRKPIADVAWIRETWWMDIVDVGGGGPLMTKR